MSVYEWIFNSNKSKRQSRSRGITKTIYNPNLSQNKFDNEEIFTIKENIRENVHYFHLLEKCLVILESNQIDVLDLVAAEKQVRNMTYDQLLDLYVNYENQSFLKNRYSNDKVNSESKMEN